MEDGMNRIVVGAVLAVIVSGVTSAGASIPDTADQPPPPCTQIRSRYVKGFCDDPTKEVAAQTVAMDTKSWLSQDFAVAEESASFAALYQLIQP